MTTPRWENKMNPFWIGILNPGPITEYFCNGCGQLRLSLRKDKETCGNCGSDLVQHAPVNTLDKAKLKAIYAAKQEEGG